MKTMEKMTDVWLEYAFKQYGKSERLKVHMVICNKLIFEALTIRGNSTKRPSPARTETFAKLSRAAVQKPALVKRGKDRKGRV